MARPANEAWVVIDAVRTADGANFFLHDYEGRAAAATASDTIAEYLIAWPSYFGVDGEERGLAGGLMRRGNAVQLVPRPSGLRHMIAPRAVTDGRGGLHLIWGDADSSVASLPKTVWHAHFDGIEWDRPELLADQSNSLWGGSTASPLVRLSSGALLVIAKTGHISRELAVFRREASWTRTVVPTGAIAGPSYLSVVEVAADSLVLAGVSAHARPGGTDLGSVFVSRSGDGGRTWTLFQRLSGPGERPPHFLRLVRSYSAGGDALHVVLAWHTPDAQGDTLHAYLSRDAGITWTPLPPLGLPPRTVGFDMAVRCDGRVEVAAAARMPSDVRLMDLWAWVWHPDNGGGRWRRVISQSPPNIRTPRFVSSGTPLRLLLGVLNQPPGRSPHAITVYASRVGYLAACEIQQQERPAR